MKLLLLILLIQTSFVNAQDIKEVWFTQNGQMVSSLCYGQEGYQLNFTGDNCDKYEIIFPDFIRVNGSRDISTSAQVQQQFKVNSTSKNTIITQVQFKRIGTRKIFSFQLNQRAYPPVFVGYHCSN